jgi:hypothetical protein
MNSENHNTILAFLLALSDLETPLNDSEKQTLANIATELDLQPLTWTDYIEPILLNMIEFNPQLNQQYIQYKSQLNQFPENSQILSEIEQELKSLTFRNTTVTVKGFKPTGNATGYESQINNIVVLISRSEDPETVVKQLSPLDKLKQILGQSGQ